MYSVGDMVIYGESGVCCIEDIAERPVFGSDNTAMFYTLKPCYQGYTVQAPVENCKIFMRSVISVEEADALIERFAKMTPESTQGFTLRELMDHYESKVRSHNPDDLCQMMVSIYEKKQQAIQNKKKVGAVDEKYMKRAEELLFGELSVVLNKPKSEIREYLIQRLGRDI